MLHVSAPFPHVGSTAFMDAIDENGRDIVEQVRILARRDDGEVLIAIKSHRYPRQIASGNRTVPLASLRETQQPTSIPQPSGRKPKSRRR